MAERALGVLMDGKPSSATEASREIQLDEFAKLAREAVVFIDLLSQPTVTALDAAGWHSGKTFALRADLARAAECADRAKRRLEAHDTASASSR